MSHPARVPSPEQRRRPLTRGLRRSSVAGVATLAAVLLAAGCAPLPYEAPTPTSAPTTDSAPAEAEAEAEAVTLDACAALETGERPAVDPATFPTGPTTATFADNVIDPITTAPAPTLPVTVQSHDGRQVTVTDASRIIAVDLYGTLG